MKIKDDLVAKSIYFKLSKNEWDGLQVAIEIIRDTFPKIDLYESILGSGNHISFGNKPINKSKGNPLFVITKPKPNNPAHIKIRIDSEKDRETLIKSLGCSWSELQDNKFMLSNFNNKKLISFLNNSRQLKLISKRTNGTSMFPSDYDEPTPYPDENDKNLWEGTQLTVKVNKYERNKAARKKCIEHYGSKCYICSFDFGKIYGPDYSGFIHVHHVMPISQINKEYIVNPIKDLIPVCPNCHAVIHFSGKAISIKDVKNSLTQCANDFYD